MRPVRSPGCLSCVSCLYVLPAAVATPLSPFLLFLSPAPPIQRPALPCTRAPALQAEFRTIVFALSYFHAALLERKKFGVGNLPGATSGIGWNMNYPFNTGDLLCCGQTASNYLENNSKVRGTGPEGREGDERGQEHRRHEEEGGGGTQERGSMGAWACTGT